jgi:hypothetical protein
MQQWTEKFAAELRQHCPSAPTITDAAETASVLNTLAGHISTQCWPGQPSTSSSMVGMNLRSIVGRSSKNKSLCPFWHTPIGDSSLPCANFSVSIRYLLRQTEQSLIITTPCFPSIRGVQHPGHIQLQKLIEQSPRQHRPLMKF